MAANIDKEVKPEYTKNPMDYLPKQLKNSLFFVEVLLSEILSLIAKLEIKKACGLGCFIICTFLRITPAHLC